VREKKDEEEQRKRAIKTVGLLERDSDFSSLLPSQRKFKEAVADFNPYLPEFVIVAPLRLYQAGSNSFRMNAFVACMRKLSKVNSMSGRPFYMTGNRMSS
jgi:hypothetical protein